MVKGFLERLRKKIASPGYDELESEEGYLELDTNLAELKAKAVVRPFNIEDFDDLKPVLDSLREGKTIALVNIKALRDKDMVELKRTVNKLKKTADAIGGEIAGFGEDYIIVTPSFATIHRDKGTKDVKSDESATAGQDQE